MQVNYKQYAKILAELILKFDLYDPYLAESLENVKELARRVLAKIETEDSEEE